MKRISFILLLFICTCAYARVEGVVLDDQGEVLVGANVYWANTTHGTSTGADGHFALENDRSTRLLVASYMGFHNDTTEVSGREPLTIVLVSDLVLGEITITERQMAVLRSRQSAFDTQSLGTGELFKAACCNLSEAFETNPSVDVAYADAATGAKQIRLLGLSGTYVQLLTENTPAVRGLAQQFGLAYIPGTWMQSVQVSKGASSIINGYEAVTGQINVEYIKPQSQSPVSVNAMLNTELHPEVNVEGGWKIPIGDKEQRTKNKELILPTTDEERTLATGLMTHYEQGFLSMDDNKDGFADMPKSQNVNIANRWYYKQDKYIMQALVRGLYDHRVGGQTSMHNAQFIMHNESPYLIDLRAYRVEGWMKNGIIFDPIHGTSLGIIAAASYHNQQNLYGARLWNATQTNAYLNAIFEKNWQDLPTPSFRGGALQSGLEHKLSAGFSLNYDKYDETLQDTISSAEVMDFGRQELTPGVFAEYALKAEKLRVIIVGSQLQFAPCYRDIECGAYTRIDRLLLLGFS